MIERWLPVTPARVLSAAVVLAGAAGGAGRASAQLAVSSNDNKAVLVDGVNTVPRNPRPDTVSIIDLNVSPPRIIAEVEAPGGWSAPPQSVAVTPDESLALVTGSARVDPANPARTVFNDALSVIDLKASPPAVIATLRTGLRAAGVSINRAGTLALVGNRAEGTVSVFSIEGKTVRAIGKVDLGAADSEPSLPVFTPDGKMALVTLNNAHKVAVLSIDGTKVEYTKRDISANLRPYGLEITPDGAVAIAANIGNGPTGGIDTLTVIDLRLDPPRAVSGVFVGLIPEGISLSSDGQYLAVALQNGSNLPSTSPYFNPFGLLKIFRVSGATLTPLAEARIGRWCQGIAWNRRSTTILVQCAADNAIQTFRFDGRALAADVTLKPSGSPTGIRTAQR
jgi:DNA-binding beta-propeller fold protein YncE